METAEPVRRTSEIEDVTNLYFIHPISAALVPWFARLGVSANLVSLAGMAFGVLAGVAYNHYEAIGWTVAGFALMIAWHVMDGADGQLARLTRTQSPTGKVLDGICDYVTFTAVYVGLALALSRQDGDWVWLLVVVSGGFHAAQSAAYEAQRQAFDLCGRQGAALPGERPAVRPGLLLGLYERLQSLATGASARFQERLAEALRRYPENAASLRQRYRAAFAPAVRRWSILSANYRTLGLFLCAALKRPLLYFWFEIIGFSAILVWLLYRQRTRYAAFLRRLAMAT